MRLFLVPLLGAISLLTACNVPLSNAAPPNDLPVQSQASSINSTNQKIQEAEEVAMAMDHNGFNQIKFLFPDLTKVMDINKNDDQRNIMKAGPESWYYSAEGDFTIAVCNEANSPIHIFEGKTPAQTEIDEAATMIKEMMAENKQVDSSISTPESPQYLNYTSQLYSELLGKKSFALFFHASWCPTCIGMEQEITRGLSLFPKGTIIVKADYDSEIELKKKYGVTYQSVVIVFDAQGNPIKILAAPTNEDLIEAIKSSL